MSSPPGDRLHPEKTTIGSWPTRLIRVEGSGTPLVLLHGFGDQAETWTLLLRLLQARGRTAIAADMPGFGRAGVLDRGAVLPQLADFATTLVEQVAEEYSAPILVGNSLGGTTTWLAGRSGTLPVRGLVPIAPAGFGFTPTLSWADRLHRVFPTERSIRALPFRALREVLLAGYASGAGPGRRLDPEIREAWMSQWERREDVARLLRLARRVLADLREFHTLPTPAHPTLLLWGSRDRLVRRAGAPPVGTESLTLPGTGHCPQLEDPVGLAEHLLGFTARVTGPAASAG